MRRVLTAVVCLGLATSLGACGSGPKDVTASGASPASSADGRATSSATSSSAPASPAPASSSRTSTGRPTPGARCASTAARLPRPQQVGQLLMVGLDASWEQTRLDDLVAQRHVGNVIYLGGWTGASRISDTSSHLQSLVSPESTGGIGLLVAADQEGGIVRQLRGDGFTTLPAAREQGTWRPDRLTESATRTGRELRAVGVNVDLAPVADTVPASVGRANDPIGRWGREYGSEPAVVSRAVTAVTRGLVAGGVGATVKHFPGLGRIRSNTDFSTTGITDGTVTANDPTLRPFADGAGAGAAVMVSSASYPRLDVRNQAVFSRAIIDGLLRKKLRFDGLVMTDDMGNAVAVRSTPPGQRAMKFLDAGGDLVITGQPADAAPMADALLGRAQQDPAFAARITQSTTRVLAYKERLGLVRCG